MSQVQKEPMSNTYGSETSKGSVEPLASPFSDTTLVPPQKEVVAELTIDESQSEDEDYCHGCDTGADAIEAHAKWCNIERGFLVPS